jgi:uncharacterized membrane protein YjfL (UPF0719 family)
MFELIYWDNYYNKILLLNLLIVIGIFTAIRLFSGVFSRINPSYELIVKDNPAFGLSMAGVTFAVSIILSGTIYGRPGQDIGAAAIAILIYGGLGLALMITTRFIFDKITLPRFSMRDQILQGNIAASITDVSNMIAVAIIIRAVMVWVSDNSLEGIMTIIAAFIISQILLCTVMVLKRVIFGRRAGRTIQSEIEAGNIALALRFGGRNIATAFAISIAAHLVVYEVYDIASITIAWFAVSIAAIAVLKILAFIAERIILFKVDLNKEVVEQRNIAIGAVQAVIYISMGMLLASL